MAIATDIPQYIIGGYHTTYFISGKKVRSCPALHPLNPICILPHHIEVLIGFVVCLCF
jgi:hypothetical protein